MTGSENEESLKRGRSKSVEGKRRRKKNTGWKNMKKRNMKCEAR